MGLPPLKTDDTHASSHMQHRRGQAEHSSTPAQWTESQLHTPGWTQDTGTTKTTTEEFTDDQGNCHVKTVTTKYNADGQEISQETRHWTRYASGAIESSTKSDDGEARGHTTEKTSRSDSRPGSGWFWK